MTGAAPRISYTRPSITELEIAYTADAAANGWGDRCYDYIVRFEDGFRRHLGAAHAIATSSCTGAMHMGLSALGIGRGDEVILADTNWIATAAPIVHLGATPVFVDILPGSWCIDPAEVERHVTQRTKAIIATHIYGNLCDMDRLLDIGRRHGIPVIEDAAEAIGSQWHGRRAGSMGTFSTFLLSRHQDADDRRRRHVRDQRQRSVRKGADAQQSWPRPQPEKTILAG